MLAPLFFLNPCGLSKHLLSWLDPSPGLPGDPHPVICFLWSEHISRQLMFTCLINNWLQPFQFSPLIGSQNCVTYHVMSSILLDFYIIPLMPSSKLKDHLSNLRLMRKALRPARTHLHSGPGCSLETWLNCL